MTEIAASNLLTYSQITIPAGSVPKASALHELKTVFRGSAIIGTFPMPI